MALAGGIAAALVDLGLAIAPEIGGASTSTRRGTWLGLVIVALLIAGLALVGEGVGYVVESVLPHREQRP